MNWLKVNILGIGISALAYLIVGAIFYSHWGLARFWTDLTKHMQKEADHAKVKIYLGAFISAALIAYAMGIFVNLLRVKTLSSGLGIGFVCFVGFILPTIFSPVLFGKKPIEMFWLDAVFYLVIYLIIGAIAVRANA